jgi:hypothetical protein
MQTIALICTDDTGEGVLSKPEDPDERFDDMTLIGESFPLAFLLFFQETRTEPGRVRFEQFVRFQSRQIGQISSSNTSARNE